MNEISSFNAEHLAPHSVELEQQILGAVLLNNDNSTNRLRLRWCQPRCIKITLNAPLSGPWEPGSRAL